MCEVWQPSPSLDVGTEIDVPAGRPDATSPPQPNWEPHDVIRLANESYARVGHLLVHPVRK